MNETRSTPTLSETVAAIVTMSDTVVFVTGDVIATAGGVRSTVTARAVEPTFPELSRATTLSVCAPSANGVVSHDVQYGAVLASLVMSMPSTRNRTPATA